MRNFANPQFEELFSGISAKMPGVTFGGIIATYLITAALNSFFIPLPLFISIPAALAIQFGRFSIVFQDFVNPTGRRSPWPPLIATAATLVALAELAYSIKDLGYSENRFWSLFLFGAMVIVFGYLLEITFISKGVEAYGMTTTSKRTSGAATANTHHRNKGETANTNHRIAYVEPDDPQHEGEAYRPTMEGIANGGYYYSSNGNGKAGN